MTENNNYNKKAKEDQTEEVKTITSSKTPKGNWEEEKKK